MILNNSRYYYLATVTYDDGSGQRFAYKQRRFLPQGYDLPLLVEVTVADGDRLDLIAARTLGDPLQFWQVADANNAMNPFDLTGEIGLPLRVPQPQFPGGA